MIMISGCEITSTQEPSNRDRLIQRNRLHRTMGGQVVFEPLDSFKDVVGGAVNGIVRVGRTENLASQTREGVCLGAAGVPFDQAAQVGVAGGALICMAM